MNYKLPWYEHVWIWIASLRYLFMSHDQIQKRLRFRRYLDDPKFQELEDRYERIKAARKTWTPRSKKD